MSTLRLNLKESVGRHFLLLVIGMVLWCAGSVVQAQVEPAPQPADTVQAPTTDGAPVAPPDSVRPDDVAEPDTSEPERAIVTADSLSAQTRSGLRVQELFDNVRVRQDTTRLRSNYGLRYLNTDELLFTGDVVIYERGDTLRADTVRYNKQTKVGYARSNVELTDGDVTVYAPRATYYTEEKRSVFPDSVTLVDSSRVLRAKAGTYYSKEQRAEFYGNVHLTDPETYLESDSLTYYRDQDRSIAVGRVFIRRVGRDEQAPEDTTTRTYLFGDWADNQEKKQYSHVKGDALLVRVRMDSTGTPEDTLIVRGERLEAFRSDTYRRLIAVQSVRIWQSDLAAVADSAVYDRVISTGAPDTLMTPSPIPDTSKTRRNEALNAPLASADSLAGPRAPPPTGAPDSVSVAVSDTTAVEAAPSDSTGGPANTTAPPGDTATRRVDTVEVATADSVEATPDDTLGMAGDTSHTVADAPEPPTDTSKIVADTSGAVPADTSQTASGEVSAADTTAGGSRMASARAPGQSGRDWDRPIAKSEEQLPLEESRLFKAPVTWFERSQVWGDSIRVRSHNRSLDTVFVRTSAFAAQRDTTLDRIQQLKGKHITAFFQSDSLRRILAQPNAQAIRFLATEEGELNGAARASGDRIVLRFRDGSVKRVSVIGGVESTYYRTAKSVPDPFELKGFQWTPERKPTKNGLLDEERVRERFDLGPRSRRPPLARGSGSVAPPDTSADEIPASQRDNERSGSTRGVRLPASSDSLSVPIDSLQNRRYPPAKVASDSTETSDSLQ